MIFYCRRIWLHHYFMAANTSIIDTSLFWLSIFRRRARGSSSKISTHELLVIS